MWPAGENISDVQDGAELSKKKWFHSYIWIKTYEVLIGPPIVCKWNRIKFLVCTIQFALVSMVV